jgi:PAS domain S-box-containing protein
MEQMLGYSKEKVIGKMFFYQLFSLGEWEQFEKKLYGAERGGKNRLFLGESTLISKAGLKIPVKLSATVLFREDKKIGIVVSVVYGIMDRHEGTISVENEVDKGTAFTIKLPINKKDERLRACLEIDLSS